MAATPKRISLAPLTPEEAIRKIMCYRPPKEAPKKPTKATKGKKKG